MLPISQIYYNGGLRNHRKKKDLRKFLSKGSNYREKRRLNFGKSYFKINLALEDYIEEISIKKLATQTHWKESALTMAKEKK